jgi:hypothetical protein
VNLSIGHIVFMVVLVLVGVVFAGWFRSLPGVSSLPQY